MHEKTKFGEIASENLNIGDIVEWSRWCVEKSDWDRHYGIITEISNEIRGSRLVSISKVLTLNEPREEREFFTLSLRLVSNSENFGD